MQSLKKIHAWAQMQVPLQSRVTEGPMFDWDSRSVVRPLIGLFAFRSNPVSKVYQHRSRNDGILEVTWSTGSLRKNCKRHYCWGVNT